MSGGSTSFGNCRTTVATRSRTSCAAVSMSRSRLKVTRTIDWPVDDTERSSLMPSTRLTASSMMSETCDSTSSTEAPGSSVWTRTVGRSMTGKRSTPRRKNDEAPTTTNARMIIAAKTGR
jgi:hypothetical protein